MEGHAAADTKPARISARERWTHRGSSRADQALPRANNLAARAAESRLRLIAAAEEVGLYLHVLKAPPHRARQSVPGLRLTVIAFRAPHRLTPVHPPLLLEPHRAWRRRARNSAGYSCGTNYHLAVSTYAFGRQSSLPARSPRNHASSNDSSALPLRAGWGLSVLPRGHFTMSCRAS